MACMNFEASNSVSKAEMKGTTPSEYGLVFGLFYLTTFIFSPICGKMIRIVSPEFLRDCGMLVVGSCFILFGFLDKSPPGKTFLTLAYIVRIAEGIGCASFKTSNFIIVAIVYPDSMATALGTIETMNGLGIILGPPIGSILYQIGGYTLPFVLAGTLVMLIGLVTYFILPTLEVVIQPKSKPITFCKFLRSPLVLVHVSLLILASSCLGFNFVTLEPSLRKFNLSEVQVGMYFAIGGAFYGMSSPVWGYFADNRINPKILALMASLLIAVAYTLIGPSPIFTFNGDPRLSAASLVIFGLGYGGTRVIAFVDCLKDALKKGLPNDLSTTGIISGTFTAGFGIGFFLGPTLGGIIFESIGYPLSTSILAILLYLDAIVFMIYIVQDKLRTSRKAYLKQTVDHQLLLECTTTSNNCYNANKANINRI